MTFPTLTSASQLEGRKEEEEEEDPPSLLSAHPLAILLRHAVIIDVYLLLCLATVNSRSTAAYL